MSHTIAVVAHRARSEQAHKLMEDVGAAYMHMDSGTVGCEASHRKAWTYLAGKTSDWGLVLEDDAQPVDNFTEQVEQALTAAPTPIVSFYLGRRRPPHWQPSIHYATDQADHQDACFITGTHLLHAVAVAIRTDLIPDMLQHTEQSIRPWDYAIGAWALEEGHNISYTWPSLVEHEDGPTLATHTDQKPRTPGRKAWKVGARDRWTAVAVKLDAI